MRICKNCGCEIYNHENICLNCGEEQEPMVHKEPNIHQEPVFHQKSVHTKEVVWQEKSNPSGGTASMVCGIVSIVLSTGTFCCLGTLGTIFGLISGIIAIILAKAGMPKRTKLSGARKVGFITGIVGTVMAIVFGILFLAIVILSVMSDV